MIQLVQLKPYHFSVIISVLVSKELTGCAFPGRKSGVPTVSCCANRYGMRLGCFGAETRTSLSDTVTYRYIDLYSCIYKQIHMHVS